MIVVGPTGNTVKGSVLDVAVKPLEEKLRQYDAQLYIKWNTKKRSGQGVWEIRRRPNLKTAVFHGEHNGMNINVLEYKELDLESHILDAPVLSYDILTRLYKMDQWRQADLRDNSDASRLTHYLNQAVANESRIQEEEEEKLRQEAYYRMRSQKAAIRELKEVLLRGENPNNIAKFWK